MKATDRSILIGVALLGLLAAFWFLIAAPKREQLSGLEDDVATLQGEVETQESLLASADEARKSFPSDYHSLVVLGKAVPSDDDAASLIDQTNTLAQRSGIEFRGLVLTNGDDAAAAAPPPASETTADQSQSDTSAPTEPVTTPAVAPATEAAAASLPIGASVGSAGLPVMPYDFDFRGDFFQIADFMGRLDDMVRVDHKGLGVDGRLLTIDSFSLAGDKADGFPLLDATLHVTSFVAPADEGETGGATPAAPAAATSDPGTASGSSPTPTASTLP
jgi:hypothetical protein